jgi:hypothetical protein
MESIHKPVWRGSDHRSSALGSERQDSEVVRLMLFESGMKCTLLFTIIALLSGSRCFAQGSHRVEGHYRADGSYVAPHYQTNPNNTPFDNWSTKGNYNPYTGQPGTITPPAGYFDSKGVFHPYGR